MAGHELRRGHELRGPGTLRALRGAGVVVRLKENWLGEFTLVRCAPTAKRASRLATVDRDIRPEASQGRRWNNLTAGDVELLLHAHLHEDWKPLGGATRTRAMGE